MQDFLVKFLGFRYEIPRRDGGQASLDCLLRLKPCLEGKNPARPRSADLTKWGKVLKWKHGLAPVYHEYHKQDPR